MHSYALHIGDFNTGTQHLELVELGVYVMAMNLYYDTEQALDGSDFDRLARRLRCRNRRHKEALRFVLDEYLDLDTETGCYVHQRCERELIAYRETISRNNEAKAGVNKRQVRLRAERAEMFAALKSAGQHLPWNTSMADLRIAFAERCKTCHATCHAPVTANHLPITNNQEIPPNPPEGGECGAGNDIANSSPSSDDQPSQKSNGQAVEGESVIQAALQLASFFPAHRRTKLSAVAQEIESLTQTGVVPLQQLLTSAAAQSSVLAKDDGKASPAVLRWLREKRWLDAAGLPTCQSVTGSVTGDWRQTRSGIEAMGEQMGIGRWDDSTDRLFATYEQRVVAKFDQLHWVTA